MIDSELFLWMTDSKLESTEVICDQVHLGALTPQPKTARLPPSMNFMNVNHVIHVQTHITIFKRG